MNATTNTTYKTRNYADYNVTVTANDNATITKVYTTKYGKFYDVATTHNDNLNVHESVLNSILVLN